METATVTTKGQIVIPVAIRERLGITQGTKICFVETGDHHLLLKPLDKSYFANMAGILKTKGKLSQKLLKERALDAKKGK